MLSKRRAMEIGAEHGLTGMQAMLLFLLDEPHPMYNFKKVFNCDASNITGLVDGLEQKKLAARFASPKDRRVKMVKLSGKGERLRVDMLRQAAGGSSLLAKLSANELQVFSTLLRKITNGSSSL